MELGHPVTPPAALLKITPARALRHKPHASESCPGHVVGLDVEPENRGPRSGSGLLTWATGKSSTLWPLSPVSAVGRPAFLAV